MGLALVLAEQYVRESQEEEEECDGFSLVGWSHVEHSPNARGVSDLESKRRQEFLSLPMRSTRSRDVRMRLVSNGSTVCELEPRQSAGKAVKTGGRGMNLLKRPVKWIRGIVNSLS
ncbi:hypothetical protein GGI09_002074 [Coemansia sp. S100]|nr:hypothetical protein GGI16_004807 [Coemansia sp. S142-1]KAJ2100847.1 hypothetical protein GGI09_002074 [Coemansia sp. S100]